MVLLVALTAIGCSRSSKPGTGRLAVTGSAEVGRQGEAWRPVSASRDLRVGERLRVVEGTAILRLGGDRRLELRKSSQIELRAAAKKELRAVLLGGDVLAVAPDGPLTVEVPGTEVMVNGAARVSRGTNLLVASYERASTVNGGGKSLTVPALRQAAVPPDGVLPVRPKPLEYSATDSWDERYLSDAFDLGEQLATRSRGFTSQLGAGEGRTVGFFGEVLPGLAKEPAFDGALFNPNRPPGETLVGAAIVLEGKRDSFTARWNAVFAFHDDGAPWGLVALDQGVERGPLLAAIDAAIRRKPAQFAEAPRPGSNPGVAPTTLPPAPVTTRPPAPPTTASAATTGRPSQPTTTTTAAPVQTPSTGSDGPLRTGVPVVDNTVNSLVDTLNALLRSLGPTP
jgi:hypothetical protein